jgi:penicillin G amidase
MRCLWRFLVALVVLVAAAAKAIELYVWRVLPQTAGRATVRGIASDVRIERDAEGIPTIRAASVREALFGHGYAHAQDRQWQLETHRRIGSGRLAEAFGAAGVDSDRFLHAPGARRGRSAPT